MGPSHSLRIGDDPSAGASSGQARDVLVRSTVVGPQNVPKAPFLPLGKGKRKKKPDQVSQGVGFPQVCRSTCRECGT